MGKSLADLLAKAKEGKQSENNNSIGEIAKTVATGEAKPRRSLFGTQAPKTEPTIENVPAIIDTGTNNDAFVESKSQSAQVHIDTPPSIDEKEFQFPHQPEAYTPEQVGQIKGALELLANSMNNREMVGQSVYHLLHQIKQNPKLSAILAPEDLGLMVRGLRQSYGVVVQKKTENRSKRQAKVEDVDKLVDDLSSMGISFT